MAIESVNMVDFQGDAHITVGLGWFRHVSAKAGWCTAMTQLPGRTSEAVFDTY